MFNWLRDKVLMWVGDKLNGKKTYIAGVGFVLLGISGVVGRMYPDAGLPDIDWEQINGYFMAAMAAFGLGHKIEKSMVASNNINIQPTEESGIKG